MKAKVYDGTPVTRAASVRRRSGCTPEPFMVVSTRIQPGRMVVASRMKSTVSILQTRPASRVVPSAVILVLLGILAAACVKPPAQPTSNVVHANDNRHAAGTMRGETLFVHLEVRTGRWFPEDPKGQYVDVPAIGEVGKVVEVPGPLIRVVEGTVISAQLTNALTDSTVTWIGMQTKPGLDSLRIKPGETKRVRFIAGAPGTYFYSARVGVVDYKLREREQTVAAFVVDAKGARADDRVFVMNIWSEPIDSINYRNALAINGRAWPYTERIQATAGDTLRWRVVNGTTRVHPMHLHGFYFRISNLGDGGRDSVLSKGEQPNVVTQLMAPFSTMAMQWVAEREGNWLFHCHLAFHVDPGARFTRNSTLNSTQTSAQNKTPDTTPGMTHDDHKSGDVGRHMAGLILGISVAPKSNTVADPRVNPRKMRIVVNEARRRGRSPRAMGFVLQAGADPARDSVEIPGTPLVLTRGEPTDITVVNRLNEGTSVHWHGIELESFSDGVSGWSGSGKKMAPLIAPSDSFTAHLTLRRAGTFIYHTHLNDLEQLTSGMYGAIVVLEPGQKYDAKTDHLFVVGWDGQQDPPHLLVNGDSLPTPLVLAAGVHHRLRFVFIGLVNGDEFSLRSTTDVVQWRALARDGYEMPAAQQRVGPARITGWAGQTYDFDILPSAPGQYLLVAGDPKKPQWQQRIEVR